MHIVTDRGADLATHSPSGAELVFAPLTITLDESTFTSGIDIEPEEFYKALDHTDAFPTTSQPAPGDFARIYADAAKSGKEILSIHISSGLSGTVNAARVGAEASADADVEIYDTKTLSAAQGWHVQAAANASAAGWSRDQVVGMLRQVTEATEVLFTLPTLKYLIHGGRIGHLKGLLAQVLNIRPIIGVEKQAGTYVTRGQARTFDRALASLAEIARDMMRGRGNEGDTVRAQIVHGYNPKGVAKLKAEVEKRLNVKWLPTLQIAPVLGAHTGAGVVGLVFALDKALPAIL
jgi:DegV family protein with EDD domain